MKDEINLLPVSAQSSRMRNIYRRRLRSLVTICIIALVLILLAQIGSMLVLKESLRRLTSTHVQATAESQKLRQEVNAYNQIISETDRRAQENPLWSQHVEDILRVIPPEMSITQLEADTTTGKLLVTAVSSSRASGIAYEKSLSSLPWVKTVDAPLQNFALSAANEFTFTIYSKEQP